MSFKAQAGFAGKREGGVEEVEVRISIFLFPLERTEEFCAVQM